RIPDLTGPDGAVVSTPAQKAAVFHRKFFPPAPPIPPPPTTATPPPCPDLIFTLDHVLCAIDRLSPWKAPWPSGVPNVVIAAARHTTAPVLLNILAAGLRLGHFPDPWKIFITAALRKHTVPGAFRPIAEEECMGKVVESVLTDWMSEFAERRGLLSKNQFGG
ncbi:hypothetical protein C8R43DRAFT_833251, partial [Mycena crocata]